MRTAKTNVWSWILGGIGVGIYALIKLNEEEENDTEPHNKIQKKYLVQRTDSSLVTDLTQKNKFMKSNANIRVLLDKANELINSIACGSKPTARCKPQLCVWLT
ncbi:MAG: hypothetical protein IPL26_10740 [Leptospiraceae bacterium]|nr:hypothetical protein [Leptospiraceae bacterium]